MVPLVGPTCVGKTTLAETVAKLDPDFFAITPFTTRPKRPEESPNTYRFVSNSMAQQNQINDGLANGTILQIVTHPTGYIYGTTIDDYAGAYNLLPLLSTEVAAYKAVGFLRCPIVMIVAPAAQWKLRFSQRGLAPDDAAKRVTEAIQSLQWGIAQGDAVCWVLNPNGQQISAANNIIAYARHGRRADQLAKSAAIDLLAELNQITS